MGRGSVQFTEAPPGLFMGPLTVPMGGAIHQPLRNEENLTGNFQATGLIQKHGYSIYNGCKQYLQGCKQLNTMVQQSQRRIGVLLFPDFELLDVFRPLQMFALLQERAVVEIIMISQQPGHISSVCGPACVATVGFSNCPNLDVLLVPGGQGTRKQVSNPVLMSFLRHLYPNLELLASICTGAGLLAAAGLLNGRRATSNKQSFAWVVSQSPHVTWIPEARWVEDGNIITAGGVAAGMDMALHLVERLAGADMANLTKKMGLKPRPSGRLLMCYLQKVASGQGVVSSARGPTRRRPVDPRIPSLQGGEYVKAQYTEYDWHRDPSWDPFARLAGLV